MGARVQEMFFSMPAEVDAVVEDGDSDAVDIIPVASTAEASIESAWHKYGSITVIVDAEEKIQVGQLRSSSDRPSPQSDNEDEDQAPLARPEDRIGLCGMLQSEDAAILPKPGFAIIRI